MSIIINDTSARVQYVATSGQTVFTVPYEFFSNADLKVYINEVLKTLTTHYTVTGAGVTGGGSITLTSGATAGQIITIVRDVPVKRVTDFPTSGPFVVDDLNSELDKMTAMVQQLETKLERTIRLDDFDLPSSFQFLPSKTSRAGKTIAFDENGNVTVGEDIGNWRGAWASGTAYGARDLIKDTSNNNIYRCLVAHTSTGSLPISTNTDSAKWDIIIDAEAASGHELAAAASATAAAASATAAASSATSASSSASAASTSASNASTSATNAASSASSASTSASNAASSATAASGSASTASTAATNASNSATAASTSASNASTSATNAASSASSAASSASSASTQASNAASSASAASTSASNAASSASSASTSASNASTYATNALAAQTAAELAYDSFDDRYLGAKSSNPTLDNDGNALLTGALYFNTTANEMRVYTGSAWVAAYVSGGAGVLLSANNLSDVASASTSRTNLGLGSMATQNSSSVSITGGSASGVAVTGGSVNNTPIGASTASTGAFTTLSASGAASFTSTASFSGPMSATANAYMAIDALTDAATIAVDMSVGNNFSVTLGGNRTLGNPTNLTAGQSGIIFISQDGTGSRTLAYSSYWKFSGGTAPTLTTTANAVDALVYTVRSSTSITAQLLTNIG